MGGKPSTPACKIRGIRIIGVETPSYSVQIIMKFTIFLGFRQRNSKGISHPKGWHTGLLLSVPPPPTVDPDLAIQTEREAIRFQFPASRVRKS